LDLGTLVPTRLPKVGEKVTATDYAFCNSCKGLYTKKGISDHLLNHCKQTDASERKGKDPYHFANTKTLVEVMISKACGIPTEIGKVVAELQDGKVSDFIKADKLLLYIGQIYLQRKTNAQTNDGIRFRLRVLAKIALLFEAKSFIDVLWPKNLEKTCTIINKHMEPTTRVRCGQMLKSAMELMRNIAIKNNHSVMQQAMEDSIKLHESEFKHRVGYVALKENEKRRFGQSFDMLPLSHDIKRLSEYLLQETKEAIEQYERDEGDMLRSKKLLMCKVVLFNKRRGAEFSKAFKIEVELALSENFEQVCDIEEVKNQLTPIEIHLASCMKLLRLSGKQGKMVPVLLDRETDLKLLNFILQDPNCSDDVYVFQSTKKQPYRSDRALEDICKAAGNIAKPGLIRATALRKYCATALQVRNRFNFL
jgi:hypothetical protein